MARGFEGNDCRRDLERRTATRSLARPLRRDRTVLMRWSVVMNRVVHVSIENAFMGNMVAIYSIPFLSLAWCPGRRPPAESRPHRLISLAPRCSLRVQRSRSFAPAGFPVTPSRIGIGAGRRRPRSGCSHKPPPNPRSARPLRRRPLLRRRKRPSQRHAPSLRRRHQLHASECARKIRAPLRCRNRRPHGRAFAGPIATA